MMTPQRMKSLCSFAEFVAADFSNGNRTALAEIISYEDLGCYFDNYEDAFDGMLCYDSGQFHIHINIDNGNREGSKRGRFTVAHELAHFFINEHRLGLKYGILKPHASFHNISHRSIIETEADYFASCLLMPTVKFKNHGIRKFSLDTILHLSDSFQSSVLATIIRFAEIGTHSIFAVVSRNGVTQWFTRSYDFPYWPLQFKIGDPVSSTTIAAEYFSTNAIKYNEPQLVNVDDWFRPGDDNRANREMFEQCYYSDSYNYVLSILWFK